MSQSHALLPSLQVSTEHPVYRFTQVETSPSSSHCSSDSEHRLNAPRRESDDWSRRHSGSSMSSWASHDVRGHVPSLLHTKEVDSLQHIAGYPSPPYQSPSIATPNAPHDAIRNPAIASTTTSPSGSTTSTAKEQWTPVAELDQPTWPMYSVHRASLPNPSPHKRNMAMDVGPSPSSSPTSMKNGSIARSSSLRYHSHHPPPLPARTASVSNNNLNGKRNSATCPSALQEKARAAAEYLQSQGARSKVTVPDSQSWREFLGLSPTGSTSGEHKVVASSMETGCSIMTPLSRESISPRTVPATLPHPPSTPPPQPGPSARSPPKWALPPRKHGRVSSRPPSLDLGHPPISTPAEAELALDFDEDLLRAAQGEDFEIIKGSEGRIAVKVTRKQYDIMAWLPGFAVDNITISTKVKGTISVVANRWDNADHATWDIKLGADADMGSIRAKFAEGELHVVVSRQLHRVRASAPAVVSAPAVLAWPDLPAPPAEPILAGMAPAVAPASAMALD